MHDRYSNIACRLVTICHKSSLGLTTHSRVSWVVSLWDKRDIAKPRVSLCNICRISASFCLRIVFQRRLPLVDDRTSSNCKATFLAFALLCIPNSLAIKLCCCFSTVVEKPRHLLFWSLQGQHWLVCQEDEKSLCFCYTRLPQHKAFGEINVKCKWFIVSWIIWLSQQAETPWKPLHAVNQPLANIRTNENTMAQYLISVNKEGALCHIGLAKDRGGHPVNKPRLSLFDKCWETTVGHQISIMKRKTKTKNEWT